MIATVILALGLVLVIEGLVFALAPSRLEDALEALRLLTPDTRRLLGLCGVAFGVLLVWVAKSLGA